jgi:hypothetical protein
MQFIGAVEANEGSDENLFHQLVFSVATSLFSFSLSYTNLLHTYHARCFNFEKKMLHELNFLVAAAAAARRRHVPRMLVVCFFRRKIIHQKFC